MQFSKKFPLPKNGGHFEFSNFCQKWQNTILLRYNSLPCGTECFTGCREELRPTSKKKRHLFLPVASGCRHVICPLCYNFSCWSPPSYNLWEVFTAFFFIYLSAVLLLNVPVYVFHLLLYKAHSGQFSALRFCKLSLF